MDEFDRLIMNCAVEETNECLWERFETDIIDFVVMEASNRDLLGEWEKHREQICAIAKKTAKTLQELHDIDCPSEYE